MIILIIIIQTTHQIVMYEFNASSNNIDGWENYHGISILNTCGGIRYFGSSNSQSYSISRIIFDIESHSHIIVDAQFLGIDSNNQPDIEIDAYTKSYVPVISPQSSICGGAQPEYLQTISIIHQHNRRTVWIYISQQQGGLISLKLGYIKCQYECDGCIENYTKVYQQWKLHQYSFNQKYITPSDGWTFSSNYQTKFYCAHCQSVYYSQIKYETQLPLHQDVLIRFYKTDSIIIIVDYLYGKKTISNPYFTEILIKNHYDPIFQLIINTQTSSQYSNIRDFEIFYTQPEIMFKKQNEGCLEQIDNTCLACQEGWIQDEFLEGCHPICGDGIIQGQEQCDTLIPNHSCYQCKYSCVENCQICQFGICLQCINGFVINYNLNCDPLCGNSGFDFKLIQIDNCKTNYFSLCLECQEGWIQDEFLENCHPICGNGIIQGQEQCDALIPNHSCYQCQYQCIENCQICQFGICLQCIEGFQINANFNCDPLCGDGNLTPYSVEQCELAVNGVWDGCQNCKFISIPNCKINYFSICLECEIGFQMLENVCFPYCGDKLVIQQYEDCDDGNFDPYDGCYQCEFQCLEDCNICERGQCILKCEDGYEFVNNNCHSVCGDQIVTKEEDCDDGNTINFDGCFQCKYSCPENCSDCYQGTCLECHNQYQLLTSNQCKQQFNCGDGLVQEQEECDDGNYQADDGCKDCLFEQNWVCITMTKDSLSQCSFVKSPSLVINYLNMTQNKQYISIQFNQYVKIYTPQPLSETLNFELLELDNKLWNSSLYIIQDVGSYLSFGEYIVEIEVYKLLKSRPRLKILVNQKVAIDTLIYIEFNSIQVFLKKNLVQLNDNVDNAILDAFESQITLQYPNYLDETQNYYSQSLKRLNIYLIYILSGITIISLLLGSGELFVEIMAILQFQQYLRYINLQFPQNLEIYFSIYDLITVQPLLDFVQFPLFLQLIDIQSNQEYSDGKFNVYKQNSSLIINLSSQIFQCLIFLFLLLLQKWIKRVGYKWIFCSRCYQYILWLTLYINRKIILKISQYCFCILVDLLKLEKFMSFQGLQKALLLNGWDMIFKTLLYTRCIQTKNYFDILQLFMVSIILLLYFNIFLNFFKYNQQLNKKQRFEIISFGRQFFFLLFLIYVQNSQILQLGLLLLSSLFQIKFLYNYRSIFHKKNYIVQMVVEISVIIFMLSSFLYIQEFIEYFNQEKKIILGWIQAIILSTGIIIELISICIRLLLQIKLMCRRKQLTEKTPLFI